MKDRSIWGVEQVRKVSDGSIVCTYAYFVADVRAWCI
jgi:hypothetical protein